MNWILEAECPPFEGGEFAWYAIETRHRCEKKVVQQLSRMGFETFLPQHTEIHQWSDRRKAVRKPLFTGYTFARLDGSPLTRLRVLKMSGVMGVVSSMGKAVIVPAAQLDHLRRLLENNVPCSLHAFLRVGQRVRIRGGCLDGVEGILSECGKKLVVSIACLQRSLAIAIEGYELELV
jgi:transcription termination/antitermination protein NusG